MNDNFEKKEADIPVNEKKQNETPKTARKFEGTPLGVLIVMIAIVVFVVLYAIVNISSISTIVSDVISVLSPVILGAGLAYLLNPILKFFEKKVFKKIKNKKLLRAISLVFTYLSVILVIVGVGFWIFPQIVESVVVLSNSFDGYIDDTIDLINGIIGKYLDSHETIVVNREQLLDFVSKLFTTSGDLFQSIGSYVLKYGTGLVIGIKNLALAFFISIYVLLSKESLKAQILKLSTAFMRTGQKDRFYKYVKLCNKTFGRFFVGKIIDSLIIGAITFVTLFLFDMPLYALVSVIVGVTNIIPVFGPFIGAIPSFFLIFIQNPTKAFIFLIIIVVIQQIDGNIIGPKILGDSTGMSALGVMVAIIVMGEWMGVVGMILGVPIFAVILAIINELADHRLRKKNLPINTAEYHSINVGDDPSEKGETVSHALFSFAGHLFGHLFSKIFKRENANSAEDAGETDNSIKTDTDDTYSSETEQNETEEQKEE